MDTFVAGGGKGKGRGVEYYTRREANAVLAYLINDWMICFVVICNIVGFQVTHQVQASFQPILSIDSERWGSDG